MGIGMAKEEDSDICVITRAHGYDLYEERYDFPYWPCRRASIFFMDRIFPDSESGLKYLQTRYPKFFPKYETGLLGVNYPGFLTAPSTDCKLRIVSCSRIVPVKRVDLLMEGILKAASSRSDIQFHWSHFGEGIARAQMQARAVKLFPSNASVNFPGYESQQALYDFYRNNPVDVFINVSESEGTPVAIMEAISCGIPIIATAVGGNVEIVSDRNGILLSANPEPDEIASALLAMYEDHNESKRKRMESFRVWREKYNASVNFTNFADVLIKIRTQRG
jgi:glycosyltransferase involved in cell wall biosynthesis